MLVSFKILTRFASSQLVPLGAKTHEQVQIDEARQEGAYY